MEGIADILLRAGVQQQSVDEAIYLEKREEAMKESSDGLSQCG